jgi:uncharacterized protein (DUF302 family)
MKYDAKAVIQAALAVFLVASGPTATAADDKIGIFETIHSSTLSFEETATAVESGLRASGLTLHATHDVRVPENAQQARVYVLTSPEYIAAAAGEPPRTTSAQVLRVAVYTFGEDLKTFVNMANPRAHAMVYYVDSDDYDGMLNAAGKAAQTIRDAIAAVPGEALSIQQKPLRSEKHYQKFKGDGPARMMAKFRKFEKSQRLISSAPAADFAETVSNVAAKLAASTAGDADDEDGLELVTQIPLGENAVYFGVTSPYIEDKMVGINSRFRSDGKSETAPYPGVDHVTALPTEVLVIKEGDETLVLHYGQMWRMQLYFWDSGYRAFTANVGVPSAVFSAIEDVLDED